MTHPSSSTIRNHLLLSLLEEDFALLHPFFQPVTLSLRQVLIEPNEPITYLWFVEQGLVSVVARTPEHKAIEVANLGREGTAGLPIILGLNTSNHQSFVQVEGSALRIRTIDFQRALDTSATLKAVMLKYVYSVMAQVSSAAVANGRYTIGARLARWILMCHDRMDTNEVPLTHEFLALMLGVRRSGVTTAIHVLEGDHMIKARRGQIEVLDRDKLKNLAGGAYGSAEAEYERAIGRNIERENRTL